MIHIKFPEIVQFRQAIRNVKTKVQTVGKDANGDNIYDSFIPLPKIQYHGTVKLHGSNSAIVKNLETGEISFQSREIIITPEDDNYGFARFAQDLNLNGLFNIIPNVTNLYYEDPNVTEEQKYVVIYGEWCGGSIQKGVAISKLEKMFVVFAIMYKGVWLEEERVRNVKIPEKRVFNIYDFSSFDIVIDFQNPELSQNKLGEMTLGVEKECPVGKFFGVEGIGEGIVWKAYDPKFNNPSFWFKVKGKEHSVSNTKQLASIDVEKVNSVNELIEKVVTENRLNQGVSVIKSKNNVGELTRANTGDLIRWVFDDVIKEESDTIKESGIDQKDIGAALSKKVKEWFFKNMA